MGTIKTGDRVRCLKPDLFGELSEDQIYTVASADGLMTLREAPGQWCQTRFEKVEDEPSAESPEDIISRPSHYTDYAIEPVTFIMKNKLPFEIGNVVKYVCRAGRKLYDGQDTHQSEITDLKKAKRYIEMRINLLEGREVL